MRKYLEWISSKIVWKLFKFLRATPHVRKKMEGEYEKILTEMETTIRPYKD